MKLKSTLQMMRIAFILTMVLVLLLYELSNFCTVNSASCSGLTTNQPHIVPVIKFIELNSTSKSEIEKASNIVSLKPRLADHLARCHTFNMTIAKLESFIYRHDVLRQFIPPSEKFLTGFKNPCWFANYTFLAKFQYLRYYDRRNVSVSSDLELLSHTQQISRLQCLPYFYLIGFPKCGSTALMHYIQEHPEYIPSCTKEPHWWGDYHVLGDKDRDSASVLYYLKCFDNAAQKIKRLPRKMITGEGSTSTIWKRPIYVNHEDDHLGCETPLLIEAIQPQAKYIVLIREPIEFLYSAFYNLCEFKKEKHPHGFHKFVERILKWWRNCTENYSTVQCVYSVHVNSSDPGCGKLYRLVHPYFFVSTWLQIIPRERMLFIKTEELKENTVDVMKNVYKFLELSPLSEKMLKKAVKKEHINEQRFLHNTSYGMFQMLPLTKDLLLKFYKPFNEKLAQLLNDSRFLWKDVYY